MGGAIVSACEGALHDKALEQRFDGPPPKKPEETGPSMVLKVELAPIQRSLGSLLLPFTQDEEVAIVGMEPLKSWDCMRWRFERSATQQSGHRYEHGVSPGARITWPKEPRFTMPKRFFRAQVISSDGNGSYVGHACLLQIATLPPDRVMDNVEWDVADAKEVASYAHRFNGWLQRMLGVEDDSMGAGHGADASSAAPRIRVCAPVGCTVIASRTEAAQPGHAVLLAPYNAAEVRKYVFDGGEDFVELPQSFFHHVSWAAGGAAMVCDLQGTEDDEGNVYLVDPCVLRSKRPDVGMVVGSLIKEGLGVKPAESDPSEPSQHWFDLLHPKCGQLCKGFDPHRRGVKNRGACGLGISCGV